MKEGQGERWVDGGDQAVKGLWLCAVRALRTPQRFQLWSKYGPRRPSPAPGHTNPRPAHIPALFSWLHNASGYLSWWGVLFSFFLYLLIKCVLEELSKCEEPSCRLTFSFIYCWAAPPPAPSTPCLHLQHASIHPSEMKAIWMFLANTQRHAHTPKHMLSLSLYLSRDTSLTDGQIPSLWISEFQRVCLDHYYVLSPKMSPLERASVLSVGLRVSAHARASAPVNETKGFSVACSMGVLALWF